jgi:hypothetical protein
MRVSLRELETWWSVDDVLDAFENAEAKMRNVTAVQAIALVPPVPALPEGSSWRATSSHMRPTAKACSLSETFSQP